MHTHPSTGVRFAYTLPTPCPVPTYGIWGYQLLVEMQNVTHDTSNGSTMHEKALMVQVRATKTFSSSLLAFGSYYLIPDVRY